MSWYKYPILTIIIIISLITAINKKANILYGDALGYYIYLPASFIHNKLDRIDDLALIENIPDGISGNISRYREEYSTNEENYSIIQYTYGIAALQLPGFLSIQIWDKLNSNNTNGFEDRYQKSLVFLNVFYLLLGLFYCYSALSYHFNKRNSIIAVTIGMIGSNLLWFGFIQHGMAHIPQFMLISAVMFLSVKLKESWSLKSLYLIAFLLGLITIIRPVDIIFGLIPLICLIKYCLNDPSYRKLVFNNITLTLPIAIILFVLPFIPQLLYWKMMTGSYLYDSYSNYHFDWTKPHIIKGLFGHKNGWFVYTPLMLIAIVGYFIKSIPKHILLISILILPIHIYFTFAWFNYNYINGFGSRPMIHVYPLLIYGIAALLSMRHKMPRLIAIVAILISIVVNINFSYKQWHGRLFSDESTAAFNANTFFKNELTYHDLFYLNSKWDQKTFSSYTDCKLIYKKSHNDLVQSDTSYLLSKDSTFVKLNTINQFPVGADPHIISNEDIKNYKTVHAKINMKFRDYKFMPYDHHKLVFEVNRKGENVRWEGISINDKIGKKELPDSEIEIRRTYIDKWDTVEYHFPVNNLISGDEVKVYVWNPARQSADFRYIELSLCK